MGKYSKRMKRRKSRLFYEQDQRCYYCKGEMVLYTPPPQAKDLPDNFATIEHLDDKFSELRGKFEGTHIPRTVVACKKCNNERARQREKEQGREVLRKRASHGVT